jgi:hypothetical protein
VIAPRVSDILHKRQLVDSPGPVELAPYVADRGYRASENLA